MARIEKRIREGPAGGITGRAIHIAVQIGLTLLADARENERISFFLLPLWEKVRAQRDG